MSGPKEFFLACWWRIGFDPGNTYAYLVLEDESRWLRIGFGFFWMVNP